MPTPVYCPVGAAEFPNDNPSLHRGARWVCRDPLGHARAVLRHSHRELSLSTEPTGVSPMALPVRDDVPATTAGSASVAMPPALTAASLRALSFKGPLDIVLGRVLLPQRVEDVPPPPAFVYEPFVSSRRVAVSEPAAMLPIQPQACRRVDQREERRRVARGWRVDIAPCVAVGSAPAASPTAPVLQPAVEVQAAAPPVPIELMLTRPAPAPERTRRSRRRGSRATAGLPPSPVPGSDEVSRAISELEAAFTEQRSPRGEKPRVERRKARGERVAVERRAACPDGASLGG